MSAVTSPAFKVFLNNKNVTLTAEDRSLNKAPSSVIRSRGGHIEQRFS